MEFSNRIVRFINASIERYPLSEIRDIYKLLFQSFMGAEHAIYDFDSVRNWLYEEWESLDAIFPVDKISLIEPVFIPELTPELYRLNLASAKAVGISPETVLDEFIRVGENFPSVHPVTGESMKKLFIDAWEFFGNAVREGDLRFDIADWIEFTEMIKSFDWAPAHHSEKYRIVYRPHYRLVLSDITDWNP